MTLAEVLTNLAIALGLLVTAWVREQIQMRRQAARMGFCRLCNQPLPEHENDPLPPEEESSPFAPEERPTRGSQRKIKAQKP